MNKSELAKRLREWADEELTTTKCFLAFGELSENGRIHEQRYLDLRSAADQPDEYYKLNHFWCDECSMLVQVKPGNTVTHYCKGK